MSIARNTFYNLTGTLVPTILALVTVPAYLALIGAERYGILAIAWLILGYFGLFDLGLGRATTQRIATLRDQSAHERTIAFHTALLVNIGIGCAGMLILGPVAYYLFSGGMAISPTLRGEAVAAAPLLALAMPIATTIGVLSGGLAGRERFLEANRISITSTCLFQLAPLAIAALFGPDLTLLLVASIGARSIGLWMFWRACRREFGVFSAGHFDRGQLRALLAYGGWVTLTAIFGPFLVIIDRFAIGNMLGGVAVTTYTVPMQLTSRLSNFAASLGLSLFPRIAAAQGAETERLSGDSVAILLACLSPPVLAGLFLMQPALILWVGREIGEAAGPIGRILLVAAWINCFAQMAYVPLQARGRPDLVSKTLIAELLVYLPLLYVGLTRFGLAGAAIAYLVRMLIDMAALSLLAHRRILHLPAIAAFLALFAAVELFLRSGSFTGWEQVGMGLAAGAVALVPCWFLLPDTARAMMRTASARVRER